MNSRDIIKVLQDAGWACVKGNHWQFKHPEQPGRVTVPHPRRDVASGTLCSIER